jgi:hypothetical protein
MSSKSIGLTKYKPTMWRQVYTKHAQQSENCWFPVKHLFGKNSDTAGAQRSDHELQADKTETTTESNGTMCWKHETKYS